MLLGTVPPESTPGPQEAAASPSLGPLGMRRKRNQTLSPSESYMCVFREPVSSRWMLHCFRRQAPTPRVLKGSGGLFGGLAFTLHSCPKEGQQAQERQHGKLFTEAEIWWFWVSLPGKEKEFCLNSLGCVCVCVCGVGSTGAWHGVFHLTSQQVFFGLSRPIYVDLWPTLREQV